MTVLLFFTSEYALRFIPFLSSIAALTLFFALSKRLLGSAGRSLAMVLFAFAVPLVSFASQVKQYSSDTAIALLILGLGMRLSDDDISRREAGIAAAVGAIALWFSQPATFVAVGVLAVLAPLGWRRAKAHSGAGSLITPFIIWSASIVLVLASAISSMTPATRAFMQRYWSEGFPPEPLDVSGQVIWLIRQLTALFGTGVPSGLAYPLPLAFLALAFVGGLVLWRRDRRAALLLLAPALVALAGAEIHQYPFTDRLILFLVPALTLSIGASADWLVDRSGPLLRGLGWAVVALVALAGLRPILRVPPPYQTEDMRRVLAYVQSRWHAGEPMYVFYAAVPAMSFYAGQYGLYGFSAGGCHRGDNRRYFEELNAFRGNSHVWIVLAHTVPIYREREDILGYLDAVGARMDAVRIPARTPIPGGLSAEAFLFDLSDARRWIAASSFPVTGPETSDARLACS